MDNVSVIFNKIYHYTYLVRNIQNSIIFFFYIFVSYIFNFKAKLIYRMNIFYHAPLLEKCHNFRRRTAIFAKSKTSERRLFIS